MNIIKSLLAVSLCTSFFLSACLPINNKEASSAINADPYSQQQLESEKKEGVRGELVAQHPHTATIKAVDYARKHDFFVTGSKDSTVKVWQPDGQLIRTIDVGMWIFWNQVIWR